MITGIYAWWYGRLVKSAAGITPLRGLAVIEGLLLTYGCYQIVLHQYERWLWTDGYYLAHVIALGVASIGMVTTAFVC